MLLSELPYFKHSTIVRDADFETLGFVGTASGRAIVPVTSINTLGRLIDSSNDVAAVVTNNLVAQHVPSAMGLLVSSDPIICFMGLHERLIRDKLIYAAYSASEIDSSAEIHHSANIDATGVVVGRGVKIGPGVCIERGVRIDSDVEIEPGAVLGAKGLPPFSHDGRMMIINPAGSVYIGRNSLILSNSVIGRGLFNDVTSIGEDTIIGTGCFIAHGVHVGDKCRIGHGTRILGDTKIGHGAHIGAQSVLIDNLSIGDGVHVVVGSVVVHNIPSNDRVQGNFASRYKMKEGLQCTGAIRIKLEDGDEIL